MKKNTNDDPETRSKLIQEKKNKKKTHNNNPAESSRGFVRKQNTPTLAKPESSL